MYKLYKVCINLQASKIPTRQYKQYDLNLCCSPKPTCTFLLAHAHTNMYTDLIQNTEYKITQIHLSLAHLSKLTQLSFLPPGQTFFTTFLADMSPKVRTPDVYPKKTQISMCGYSNSLIRVQ